MAVIVKSIPENEIVADRYFLVTPDCRDREDKYRACRSFRSDYDRSIHVVFGLVELVAEPDRDW